MTAQMRLQFNSNRFSRRLLLPLWRIVQPGYCSRKTAQKASWLCDRPLRAPNNPEAS